MLNSKQGAKTQCKEERCAYCGASLEKGKAMHYAGKHYHSLCGSIVKTRTTHPGLYRVLDEIRSQVDSLYDDGNLVLANSGQIEAINSILTGMKKSRAATTLNEG